MAAETMTLTKALVELTLLTKRIDKKIDQLQPVAIRKGHSFDSSVRSQQEFERDTKASWQSIHDLMSRRRKIKSALVLANATQNCIRQWRDNDDRRGHRAEGLHQHGAGDRLQNAHQADRHGEESRHAQPRDGTHSRQSSGIDVRETWGTAVQRWLWPGREALQESNEAKLIDPLDLKKTLEQIEDSYNKFLSEVDVCLSVANATTYIEIT